MKAEQKLLDYWTTTDYRHLGKKFVLPDKYFIIYTFYPILYIIFNYL